MNQLRYLTTDGKLGCIDWYQGHSTHLVALALEDVPVAVADVLTDEEPVTGLGREYGCKVSRWMPVSPAEAKAAYEAAGLTLDDPLPKLRQHHAAI